MRNELTDNFKSGGTVNRVAGQFDKSEVGAHYSHATSANFKLTTTVNFFSLPGVAAWTTISADSPAQYQRGS